MFFELVSKIYGDNFKLTAVLVLGLGEWMDGKG
jgi:hypothetical protein